MTRREQDGFDDLPILADLRELLAGHMRTAAVQGAGAATDRRRPGRWALNGARRAGLALAVAVALAVVAVGLAALHQRVAGHHATPPAGGGNVHQPVPPASPAPSPGSTLANRALTSNAVNNVYVIKVPPHTARPAFDAVWSVTMSDGRVLTPQQLQESLGLGGGGGG